MDGWMVGFCEVVYSSFVMLCYDIYIYIYMHTVYSTSASSFKRVVFIVA